MQIRVCRTAPTVAFDELCCIRTDYSVSVPANLTPLNLLVYHAVAFAVKSQLENYCRTLCTFPVSSDLTYLPPELLR